MQIDVLVYHKYGKYIHTDLVRKIMSRKVFTGHYEVFTLSSVVCFFDTALQFFYSGSTSEYLLLPISSTVEGTLIPCSFIPRRILHEQNQQSPVLIGRVRRRHVRAKMKRC